MFLLILDSLGSVELLFIAIMALVFFGPRKLPQISRTIGKNLAEFRRASEDFKRTWEREVALEEFRHEPDSGSLISDADDSIVSNFDEPGAFPEPKAEPVLSDEADVQSSMSNTIEPPALPEEATETSGNTTQPEPLRKQDWL